MSPILWIAMMLALVMPAGSGDITLAWDASTSLEVSGYKIYYGRTSSSGMAPEEYAVTSGVTVLDVGNVLTHTLAGLEQTGTYYFTATAYVPIDVTEYGIKESGFSNEVAYSFTSCDVNGDAQINVLDIQVMANMIIGAIPVNLAFDLNSDGAVNVLDVQILSNVVLGNRTCP